MSAWWFDVRFALRLLLRSPGFTSTILALLIVGVGVTTAMFSVVEGLFLSPLPYPHPDELSVVWRSNWSAADSVAAPGFHDWKEETTTLERMAALDYVTFNLLAPGAKPEPVQGSAVSADFFPLFGLLPERGRLIEEGDCQPGKNNVAVVSTSLWQKRLLSDPNAIGSHVKLNGEVFTIIGIAHQGFRFIGPESDGGDIWIPLDFTKGTSAQHVNEHDPTDRAWHYLNVVARRKSGVSAEQAQAEFRSITESLAKRYPETDDRAVLMDMREALASGSKDTVGVLFAAVLFVYLVICINVANLLLTRAAARRADTAVRIALGAGRLPLLRQALIETLVVFALGGTGGALLAYGLVRRFAATVVATPALNVHLRVDVFALAFCVGVCLLSGVIVGLVPAFVASRIEPHTILKDTAARASGTATHNRIRSGLVIAQIACAFALLTGTGLMLDGYVKLAGISPGFAPENVVRAQVGLPHATYASEEKVLAFVTEALNRVRAKPGVESVAAIDNVPMSWEHFNSPFQIEGRPVPRYSGPSLERNAVTPGYFRTMRIPILRGRDFSEADVRYGRLVTIINQRVATRFFGGEDAIGKRISWDGDDGETRVWREVIAVVGDVRRAGLDHDVMIEAYVPYVQDVSRIVSIVARTQSPDALSRDLRDIVFGLDPEQPISNLNFMESMVTDSIAQQRWVVTLLGTFSATALLLATVGLFGLVSYSTGQRTREFAIRAALGSTSAGIVALVLRGGLRLVGAGLLLGLLGSFSVGRLLAHRMPGVASFDVRIFVAIPAILVTASILACLLPAWRTVRIPPGAALRAE